MKKLIVFAYRQPTGGLMVVTLALLLANLITGQFPRWQKALALVTLPPDGHYAIQTVNLREPFILDPVGLVEVKYVSGEHRLVTAYLNPQWVRYENGPNQMIVEDGGVALFIPAEYVIEVESVYQRTLSWFFVTAILTVIFCLIFFAVLEYLTRNWQEQREYGGVGF